MRRPVRVTRADTAIVVGLAILAGLAAILIHGSSRMISPPRPRVSESSRPALGLALREARDGGLVVERATGPAERAGLRPGDRIVRLDDGPAPSPRDFRKEVSEAPVGTSFAIEARRPRADGLEDGVLVDLRSEVAPVSPADLGLPFLPVAFPNGDGLTLRGWFVPAPPGTAKPVGAVVYGHGNASDRRDWLPIATAVHEAGLAQLLFDFAGRGDSDGDVITLGAREAEDLVAAVAWVGRADGVDSGRIAIAGRSMGAVAAILAAAEERRIRVLVLDSPFADLPSVLDRVLAGRYLPPVLVRPLLLRFAGWRAGYDPGEIRPEEAIRRVAAPILLLHGEDDALVPIEHARRLSAAAEGPVTFLPLAGEGHDTVRPEAVRQRIARYLASALAR